MKKASLCTKCGAPNNRNKQRYCVNCHAKYMRNWRKTNPISPEQRVKGIARSYSKVYLRRGKIIKKPCEVCGSENVEMHHADYSKPLEITWLCREHHLSLHRKEKADFAHI